MKEVTPCPEWEKQLSCTHPEDLSSVEQIALMAHVARCSACARTRAHYLETDDLLRSLPPIEPLHSLPTQIQHRRKGKDVRVVDFSFHLSVTARIVARHANLRQQPHIAEALNSIGVSPSTSVASDKAGQTYSQPLQKPRLPDGRSRKRFLFPVLLALLLMGGIGASYWGFTVLGRNPVGSSLATVEHPTHIPSAHPSVAAAATLTPDPYPHLAASYYGTLDDLQANIRYQMTLTQMRQNDKRISGFFSAVHMSGTFSGFLDPSKHISFTVAASRSLEPLYFTGSIRANGNLGGSFCGIDQDLQCIPNGVFGVWNVAPGNAP